MKRLHYAWIICFGCALMMFCSNGIIFNIFSVFQPYLIRSFGLSNTQSSFLITVRTVSSFAAVMVCSFYYKIFSVRTGIFLAGLCSTAGIMLYAAADNYPMLLAAAAACGIGYGLGTTVPVAMLIGRWFVKYRNLALSLCSIAASAALVGFPSMVTALIEARGISFSFMVTGFGALILSILGFLLLRNDPADLKLLAYGRDEKKAAGPGTDMDQKDRKGLRRPHNGNRKLDTADWVLLGGAVFLMGIAANTGYAHLSVLFASQGLDPDSIALALSAYGLCLLCGKLVYGLLSDHIGSYRCNWLYGAMMTAGYAGLCLSGRFPFLILPAAASAGVGMAVSVVGTVAWAWDLSPDDLKDKMVQRFQLLMSIGGLSFNIVPGVLADRFHGSYIPAFVILAVFCLVLIIMIQTEYIRRGAGNP